MFRKELGRRQDLYIGMAVTFFNIQRWISIRMDMLGGIFSAVLACYLVYASGIGPEGLGFIFNIVLSFAAVVLNWVKWYNRLEVEGELLRDGIIISSLTSQSKIQSKQVMLH